MTFLTPQQKTEIIRQAFEAAQVIVEADKERAFLVYLETHPQGSPTKQLTSYPYMPSR